jgi:hypothetical protein
LRWLVRVYCPLRACCVARPRNNFEALTIAQQAAANQSLATRTAKTLRRQNAVF